MNITIELCIFELVKVPNFRLNWKFCFLDQICPNWKFLVENRKSQHYHWIVHIQIIFLVKNRKSENYHWILHIRIGQNTKFQRVSIVVSYHVKLFWTWADKLNGICNKKRQRRVRRLSMSLKTRKARRRAGASAHKARINDW